MCCLLLSAAHAQDTTPPATTSSATATPPATTAPAATPPDAAVSKPATDGSSAATDASNTADDGKATSADSSDTSDVPAEDDDDDADSSRHHHHHRFHNHEHKDDVVSIGRNAELADGEHADAVTAVFGSATTAGEVDDDVVSVLGNTRVTGGRVGHQAVAVMGSVYVNGEVNGEVVAVLGNVELGPEAKVHGNITIVGGDLKRDPGATVDGHVEHVFGMDWADFDWVRPWVQRCLLYGRPLAFSPGLGWAWGIALGLLALYVFIAFVFRKGVDRCVQTLDEEPGHSVLAALVLTLGIPVLFVLLFITVLGIAAVPFLAIAVICAALFGKVVILAAIGKRCTPSLANDPTAHTVVGVLVGGLILLVIYTIPVVGFVVYKLLELLGLGVVAYTLLLTVRAQRVARSGGPGPAPGPGVGGTPGLGGGPAYRDGSGFTAAGDGPANRDASAAGYMAAGGTGASAAGGQGPSATRTDEFGDFTAGGRPFGGGSASPDATPHGFATDAAAGGGVHGAGAGATNAGDAPGASTGAAGAGGANMGTGNTGASGIGPSSPGGGPPPFTGPGAGPSGQPPLNAATLPRAGFGIRMGALLLDLILIGIVTHQLHDHDIHLILLAAYGAVMWKLKGSTIGGIICGLHVVRVDGRPIDWPTAIVRALGCFLSLAVVGLGFIWIAIDHDRQGWHDKIAGTAVVRAPKGASLL
jgi:hypothetical protein